MARTSHAFLLALAAATAVALAMPPLAAAGLSCGRTPSWYPLDFAAPVIDGPLTTDQLLSVTCTLGRSYEEGRPYTMNRMTRLLKGLVSGDKVPQAMLQLVRFNILVIPSDFRTLLEPSRWGPLTSVMAPAGCFQWWLVYTGRVANVLMHTERWPPASWSLDPKLSGIAYRAVGDYLEEDPACYYIDGTGNHNIKGTRVRKFLV